MAFSLVYQFNLMWLDGLILLPLIAGGLDTILNRRWFVRYSVFLTLAILSNYYIGFMLCLYSALYFFYQSFRGGHFKPLASYLKQKLLPFAAGSALVGGASAALLLPVMLSLRHGRIDPAEMIHPKQQFLDQLASKLFLGAQNWEQTVWGYPSLFCGILIFLLVFLFFCNRRFSRRDRLAGGCFLLVFLLSFAITPLNRIWHGFGDPHSFPYRYAFCFVFTAIGLAHDQLGNLPERQDLLRGLIAAVLTLCTFGFLMYWNQYEYLKNPSILLILIVGLLFAAMLVFLAVKLPNRCRGALLGLLLILNLAELTGNAYLTLSDNLYQPNSTFSSHVETAAETIQKVQQADPSLYRMESTQNYSVNDPMLLQYKGISHFSSAERVDVVEWMKRLGFSHHLDVWARYGRGNTLAANSLLRDASN